jgi:hypothetical protein
MTEPTNHTVTVLNRYGNTITAPVVHVKDLGGGRADVHIETNYHIAELYDYPATYSTPSREAKGYYHVSAKVFTAEQTYIYMGIFTRE